MVDTCPYFTWLPPCFRRSGIEQGAGHDSVGGVRRGRPSKHTGNIDKFVRRGSRSRDRAVFRPPFRVAPAATVARRATHVWRATRHADKVGGSPRVSRPSRVLASTPRAPTAYFAGHGQGEPWSPGPLFSRPRTRRRGRYPSTPEGGRNFAREEDRRISGEGSSSAWLDDGATSRRGSAKPRRAHRMRRSRARDASLACSPASSPSRPWELVRRSPCTPTTPVPPPRRTPRPSSPAGAGSSGYRTPSLASHAPFAVSGCITSRYLPGAPASAPGRSSSPLQTYGSANSYLVTPKSVTGDVN
jgi:hypothetical protein